MLTLCKHHSQGRCIRGSLCKFSHDLFDMKRVEALIMQGIISTGISEVVIPVKAEVAYIATGRRGLHFEWRITLWHSLHSSSSPSPDPIVVIHADLNTAMISMEQQFTVVRSTARPHSHAPSTSANHVSQCLSYASRSNNSETTSPIL